MYDLIVIGAGPGGYEAAAHAGKLGKKVALVEKSFIGGTCLNVGCIPTKTLLRSSRLFAECRQAAAFGVEVSSPALNMPAVVERKNKVVTTLTRGVEALLKRRGVEVIRGEARLQPGGVVVVGAETYQAANVLIATGARPAVPPIAGIEQAIDSSAALDLKAIPARVAIIGGGYIGLEFASFFAAAGAKVTVLEMLPQIAAGSDSDISSRLQQALKKAGVTILTGCRVQSVEPGKVNYDGGSVEVDCILNATGRVPNVENLGLEAIGVEFTRKGIRTSEQGRTSVPGIWACGDVTGRRLLAHAATREGLVAVNNMFGKPDRVRYDAMPAVIYTHPEAASVGRTEAELQAAGVEFKKALVPMAVAGRFLVENEGATGIVKVLVGAKYGEILGVHALGDLSSEFIVAAATMMELELCAGEVEEIVFPHPTVSEALKQAIVEAA